MTQMTSQKLLFNIDPTEGLVKYTKAVKPYHTKVLDVSIEYVYKERIDCMVTDKWNLNINLISPKSFVTKAYGYGIVWDNYPFVIDDFPPVTIKQAVGDTPTLVKFNTISNDPTKVIVYDNAYNYELSIGTPITIQSTGYLPNSTTGRLAPGVVYYVVSQVGETIEISNTPFVPDWQPLTTYYTNDKFTFDSNQYVVLFDYVSDNTPGNLDVQNTLICALNPDTTVSGWLPNHEYIKYDLFVHDNNQYVVTSDYISGNVYSEVLDFDHCNKLTDLSGIPFEFIPESAWLPNHLYGIGDFYEIIDSIEGYTSQYTVTTSYTSSNTFGILDVTNTKEEIVTYNIHNESLLYNSFLLEPVSNSTYQCVATNLDSNQLTFATTHQITNVDIENHTWTVDGILLSPASQSILYTEQKLPTTATSLLNDSTTYSATVVVDGTTFEVNVIGSTAQTFSQLLAILNSQIGGGIVSIQAGGLVVTSATIGSTSSVEVFDDRINPLFTVIADDFVGYMPPSNPTIAIVDNTIYILDNGIGPITQYTIESVVLGTGVDSGKTKITTYEQLSLLSQSFGTLGIQSGLSSVPNWGLGLGVTISSSGELPNPLSSNVVYHFTHSNQLGVFNLSTKQYPLSPVDVVDISTIGSGVLSIQKAEPIYEGAIVEVSGSYNYANDGEYYIRKSVPEGMYHRIYTVQKVARTTRSQDITDGVMTMSINTGFSAPDYFQNIASSNLYTDTFIGEKIEFTFDPN